MICFVLAGHMPNFANFPFNREIFIKTRLLEVNG